MKGYSGIYLRYRRIQRNTAEYMGDAAGYSGIQRDTAGYYKNILQGTGSTSSHTLSLGGALAPQTPQRTGWSSDHLVPVPVRKSREMPMPLAQVGATPTRGRYSSCKWKEGGGSTPPLEPQKRRDEFRRRAAGSPEVKRTAFDQRLQPVKVRSRLRNVEEELSP